VSRFYGQHDADGPIIPCHRLHSRLARNPQLYKNGIFYQSIFFEGFAEKSSSFSPLILLQINRDLTLHIRPLRAKFSACGLTKYKSKAREQDLSRINIRGACRP